jgi:hypothetical protein
MAFPLSALEKWRSSSDKRARIKKRHGNSCLESAGKRSRRRWKGIRREMATIIWLPAGKGRRMAQAACRQKATIT